ncbi:LPD7 domain-containing protein [Xanthomonas axonopodis pv. khayae]
MSLVRMEKVRRDLTLREQIEAERTELKARYGMKPTDQYRAFLAERAGRGDADALAELRRQRVAQPQPTTRERIEDREGRDPETAPIRKLAAPAGYKVDRDGNVTYYDQERRAMFTDTGPAVEFSQTERDALETGLRLALVKFGPAIRLRGGDEAFRHAMADVAADKGLYVEFSDKDLQDRYEQRREEIKAGRTYVAQPERTKPAHGGQGRTAEQEQERGQEPRQPRNTDRSR